jgi:uncharacterized membrane protein
MTSLPTRAMLLDIADNLHTPAYYVILDGWVSLAGSSAFTLRYLSVLSGLLFVPAL